MKIKIYKNLFIFIIFFTLFSCNITKRIPQGKYLLTKNIFKENGKRKYFSNLNENVELRPNKKLGFLRLGLMLYNISNPELENVFYDLYNNFPENLRKKNKSKILNNLLKKYKLNKYIGKNLWWNKFIFKNLNKPVLIDLNIIENSSKNIESFYFSKGFFDAHTKATINLKNKKGKVTYNTKTGNPYTLGSIKYQFKDPELEKIYFKHKKESEIKIGKIYKTEDFEKELNRMKNLYENYGYYNFNYLKNEIEFEINPTLKKYEKQVIINVKEKNIIEKDKNLIKTIPHFPYHFNKIKIFIQDKSYKNLYKIKYKGYDIFFPKKLKYKPSIFTKSIIIKPKGLYKLEDIMITNDNLYNLNNFDINEFYIKENKNFIQENPTLDLIINLKPYKKYELQLSFKENFSRTNNLGISPEINFLTRNIFKGAENLEISLKENFSLIKRNFKKKKYFDIFETSAQAKFNFPKFFFPFNNNFFTFKKYIPQSSIFINFNHQKNINLEAKNISGKIEYEWKKSTNSYHRLSLLNTQFIQNVESIYYDNYYNENKFLKNYSNLGNLNNINNKIQIEHKEKKNIDNYFVNSISYSYEYKNNENKYIIHPFFLSLKIETGGNLFTLLKKQLLLKERKINNKKYYTLFKVPYLQFSKVDFELRKYWKISLKKTLASRFFLGISIPYGNSDKLPFEYSYSSGGANDIRSWRAYELASKKTNDDLKELLFSDLKITMNIEYRFNIFSNINGAFFLDSGNIWSLKNNNNLNLKKFKWNNFYKEVALGTGLGIRYDVKFIILRLDLAYKLYDPLNFKKNKWIFNNFNISNPIINFGIGYPF